MSFSKDDTAWVKRGRQRSAVVRVLRKPMTASEICRATQTLNPRIQLRDVWLIAGQLKARRLVACLNPKHATGKLYALTERGRRAVTATFGVQAERNGGQIDWRKYAQVVRAKVRKLVLLELERLGTAHPVSASVLRRRLRERHPLGLNPTIRALKDLERLGAVRCQPADQGDQRRTYILSKAGVAMARQIRA